MRKSAAGGGTGVRKFKAASPHSAREMILICLNPLFVNILRVSSCGSRFYGHEILMRDNNFFHLNILRAVI
jgi:hypothetical protein